MEPSAEHHRVLLVGETVGVGIPRLLADLFRRYSHCAKARPGHRVRISVCPPRESPHILVFDTLQRRACDVSALNLDSAAPEVKKRMVDAMRRADIIVYCYAASNGPSFDLIKDWHRIVTRETYSCKLRHASMLLRVGSWVGNDDREVALARALGISSTHDQLLALHAPPTDDDLDAVGLKCCRVSIRIRSERMGVTLESQRVCPPECKVRQPHRHEKRTSEFLGTEEVVILETNEPSPLMATMSDGLERTWLRSAVAPPPRPPPAPLPVAPQPTRVATTNHAPRTERTSLLAKRGEEPTERATSWFSWITNTT